jgi:hypothetical protein
MIPESVEKYAYRDYSVVDWKKVKTPGDLDA